MVEESLSSILWYSVSYIKIYHTEGDIKLDKPDVNVRSQNFWVILNKERTKPSFCYPCLSSEYNILWHKLLISYTYGEKLLFSKKVIIPTSLLKTMLLLHVFSLTNSDDVKPAIRTKCLNSLERFVCSVLWINRERDWLEITRQ